MRGRALDESAFVSRKECLLQLASTVALNKKKEELKKIRREKYDVGADDEAMMGCRDDITKKEHSLALKEREREQRKPGLITTQPSLSRDLHHKLRIPSRRPLQTLASPS